MTDIVHSLNHQTGEIVLRELTEDEKTQIAATHAQYETWWKAATPLEISDEFIITETIIDGNNAPEE